MNSLLVLHDVEQQTTTTNTVILIELAVLDLSLANYAEVPGFEKELYKNAYAIVSLQRFFFSPFCHAEVIEKV